MFIVKTKKGGEGEWPAEMEEGEKEGTNRRKEGERREGEGSDGRLPSRMLTWTSADLVRRATR